MNLLLFKVNQLGDNLVFLPVVQTLRRLRPEISLTLFTTPLAAPLYGGPLAPQRLVAVERSEFNGSHRRPWRLWRHWRDARAARPDAALVSFDQGSVAHLLARWSGAPLRIGSANLRISGPDGLTQRVAYQAGTHVAEWNWAMGRALAAALGCPGWPEVMPPPDLSHLLAGAPVRRRGRIVIHAGSSLPYRQWSLENYAELARRLAADHEVVWLQRPETRVAGLDPRVTAAPSDSLDQLVTQLAQADLFIGNNSGPVHFASALGCRGVVISGPTHPQWDPAWHPDRWTVLRAPGLACLPCESPGGFPGHCANAAAPLACLRHWSVEAVERACREQLKSSP